MTREKWRPFTHGGQLPERPDGRDLAMVLWQVRWAELSNVRDEKLFMEAIGRLGEAFGEYPFYQRADEVQFQISPLGVSQQPGRAVARWESLDREWLIIVSAQAFTICKLNGYDSFDSFATRAARLLDDLIHAFSIPQIERVGVRYVNRLQGQILGSLPELFPKLTGVGEVTSAEVAVLESVQFTAMSVADTRLNVRSGIIQAGQTVDPAILPVDEGSWVLDLDASLEQRMPADTDVILASVGRLADVNYDYYLWARGARELEDTGVAADESCN